MARPRSSGTVYALHLVIMEDAQEHVGLRVVVDVGWRCKVGQRGYRKYRFRCQWTDEFGVRCRIQVKEHRRKFCSTLHAGMAKRGRSQPQGVLAAQGRSRQGRRAHETRLREALRFVIQDDQVREQVVAMAVAAGEERYRRGYTAGHAAASKQAKMLKLDAAWQIAQDFAATAAGKLLGNGPLRKKSIDAFRFRTATS